ncbi:hypothetical protein Efla_005781 [Eimeria flavescens]
MPSPLRALRDYIAHVRRCCRGGCFVRPTRGSPRLHFRIDAFISAALLTRDSTCSDAVELGACQGPRRLEAQRLDFAVGGEDDLSVISLADCGDLLAGDGIEKARVKWVVNCAGEPATFTESVLDVNATIREIKELVFAQEIARGLSVRVIFLGRELADSDTLASHLRLSARAAAAGPCATSSAVVEDDAPGVTLHAVLSNRPPNTRPTASTGRTPAGASGGEEGDWSVVVLGVTVLIILCICWYHRFAFPEDFTPFSSLLLLLFTVFYTITIRGVVMRLFQHALGCLCRPWRVADSSTPSGRPPAAASTFQELAQRPPT